MSDTITLPSKFGFSSGVYYPEDISLRTALERLAQHQLSTVEVNIATPQELQAALQEDLDPILTHFACKTIHAPFKGITYSAADRDLLQTLRQLAERWQVEYVLFHPDTVEDFSVITETVGSYAAFENMDNRKAFGNTVADLQEVFETCPDARWVCDLNHVYTNDRTMKLGKDLHAAFGNRLCGYHVSGYGSEEMLHTCFFLTHEDVILDALQNTEVPIIHEGGAADHPDFLNQEQLYLSKYFSRPR